jgi:hypothetical protein
VEGIHRRFVLRASPLQRLGWCSPPVWPVSAPETREWPPDKTPFPYEVVRKWRDLAVSVRDWLTTAADLHHGDIQDDDRRNEATYWLNHGLYRWMQDGDVCPILKWEEEGPRFYLLWPRTLYGALGVQIALAIARSDGVASCISCGLPFLPSRKPAKGRRAFCRRCGKRAADRLAARDYRSRSRYREKDSA